MGEGHAGDGRRLWEGTQAEDSLQQGLNAPPEQRRHRSPLPSSPLSLKNGPRVLTHNLPCPRGPRADELVTGFIFLSGATHREAEATPLKERAILPGAQMEKNEIARVTWYYLFARHSRECTSPTGLTGPGCIRALNTDAFTTCNN